MQNHMLADQLRHIYWIGGSPCSGKSSLAERLAERYGFSLYHTDEAYTRHEKVVTPESHPLFYRLTHAPCDEIWMRPIVQQIEEEIEHYIEEFPLILEELLALPKSQPVLVEGAALLPECVLPLLSRPQQAIWIVPTAEFQWTHYMQRAWAREVVRTCTNPEQAFHNWMQRDAGFASRIRQQVLQHEMPLLIVDGTSPLAEHVALIEMYFQLDR